MLNLFLILLLTQNIPQNIAFYSGSFREFFGKIKGFPFPGLAPEGMIFLQKNSAEFLILAVPGGTISVVFHAEIPKFDGIIPAESEFFSFRRNFTESE